MEPRTGCGGFACLAPIILRCVHTAMMFEVVALWWSVAWRWRRLIWRKAMREKGKKNKRNRNGNRCADSADCVDCGQSVGPSIDVRGQAGLSLALSLLLCDCN